MKKEHILQEIKRTAEANGGAPLGMQTFEKETGIKVDDWLGRHWARWGDAVREAGLTPNKLQTAFEESALMEKYIALTRELGKLPVKADMQLKRRGDTDFPHPLTFGSKPELVKRVAAYCRNRAGYEDVVLLCEQYVPQRRDMAAEDPAPAEGEIGFVYLMKSGNFYKLGRSNAAGRREYELAIQLPEKLKTVHLIRTDDPVGIEAYWHNRFETKRKNGEWFELDSNDVSAFKRRKFM
jgi:hypothetical protein